jgi:DinB superfamily
VPGQRAESEIDPAALAVVGSTPGVLRSLLGGLPLQVIQAPNAEGWSLKDIVAHLVDVEEVAFVERMQRMLDEERPLVRSIDPPARLAAGGYAARPLEELLKELEQRRARDVIWLRGLRAEQLGRVGVHDEVGEITVSDIAHQWAAHDMAHLRQMAHMLQAHLAPLMGATRGFYDV